ncbi:unnamed protein product, partial [Owenia fusiformis]
SIYSKENPTGEIRIDIAHPIGKPGRGHRPIVVKFADRSSVEKIFKYVHHLKGSDIRVARQLHREMQLKRDAQYSTFKDLKSSAANPKAVKLVQDKLYTSAGLVPPNFSKSPLEMPNRVHANAHLDASPGQPCDGFIATTVSVDSIENAEVALAKLRSTKSTGVSPYAYRLTVNDQVLTGHDDDGLFGSSSELSGLLEQGELENVLIMAHKPGARAQPLNSKNTPSLVNAVKSALAASFLMDTAILETIG